MEEEEIRQGGIGGGRRKREKEEGGGRGRRNRRRKEEEGEDIEDTTGRRDGGRGHEREREKEREWFARIKGQYYKSQINAKWNKEAKVYNVYLLLNAGWKHTSTRNNLN